jgi:Phytanoyl-CoA dioxygenase (PhyH)
MLPINKATAMWSLVFGSSVCPTDCFELFSTKQGITCAPIRLERILLSVLARTADENPVPSYGLYQVQEEMLVQRGIYEEQLMSSMPSIALRANPVKGLAGRSKGFGGSKASSKTQFFEEAKSHATRIRKEGLVRIDNVLSPSLADRMFQFVSDLREESLQRISEGALQHSDRFADVLLRSNRCDLKIPLGKNGALKTPVIESLYSVFCESPVKETISNAFQSNQAVLYELSCLISDPGSQRQVMHPDNPFIQGRIDPTLLTCFIALQDIDVMMGPTVYLPRTHTAVAHAAFAQEQSPTSMDASGRERLSPKDELLRDTPSVTGTLTKGCV